MTRNRNTLSPGGRLFIAAGAAAIIGVWVIPPLVSGSSSNKAPVGTHASSPAATRTRTPIGTETGSTARAGKCTMSGLGALAFSDELAANGFQVAWQVHTLGQAPSGEQGYDIHATNGADYIGALTGGKSAVSPTDPREECNYGVFTAQRGRQILPDNAHPTAIEVSAADR